MTHASSAVEAAAAVRSGEQVVMAGGVGLPQEFCRALAARARAGELENVTVHHTFALGPAPHLQAPGLHLSTWFAQAGVVAEGVAAGAIRFIPCHFSRMSDALARVGRLDHLVIQVAPPRYGAYSYGVFLGYMEQARRLARRTVCEVNARVPFIGGASIPCDEVADAYEVAYDLPELPLAMATEGTPAARIADLVADMIPDGATLQLGYGAVTDAVVARLGQRRDLGLHTETFTDAVIPLIEAGVVTNRRKGFQPGVTVCTLIMGTRRLYEFVDSRSDVEMHPVETVNDPAVIGWLDIFQPMPYDNVTYRALGRAASWSVHRFS